MTAVGKMKSGFVLFSMHHCERASLNLLLFSVLESPYANGIRELEIIQRNLAPQTLEKRNERLRQKRREAGLCAR